MLLFREKIPSDWLPSVLEHLPEILVDHAHLERKAATTSLNLEKYPELFPRVEELNAIARALPEPALAELLAHARRLREPSADDVGSFIGRLRDSPNFNGDPVEIQRRLRDEWR